MLPAMVDADKVQARFEHGVLFVTLPKNEAAKPRRIRVNDVVERPPMQKEPRTELANPRRRWCLLHSPVDILGMRRNRCCLPTFRGEARRGGTCGRKRRPHHRWPLPCPHEGVDYLLCEYGVGDYLRAFSISEHIDWQKDLRRAQRRRPDGPPAEGGGREAGRRSPFKANERRRARA